MQILPRPHSLIPLLLLIVGFISESTANDIVPPAYEKALAQLEALTFESQYEEALAKCDSLIQTSYQDKLWEVYFRAQTSKGNILSSLSKTKESQLLLESLVDSIKTLVGDPSTTLRECYNSLGECMGNQGKLKAQHTYFELALATHLKLPEGTKGDLYHRAILYNNLAMSYGEQGDLGKQLVLLQEAILHPDPQTKKDSFYHALFFHNLGYTYHSRGDFNEAVPYLEKGKQFWQAVYGAEYFYLSYSYNALASCFSAKKAYHQALLLYEKSKEIRSHNLGERHPLIASCINNIGLIHLQLKDYNKATEHFRMAADIHLRQSSPNWPLIATYYQNIAVSHFYHSLHDPMYTDSVGKYFKRTQQIKEKYLPPLHPSHVSLLDWVGRYESHKGNFLAAQENWDHALDMLGQMDLTQSRMATQIHYHKAESFSKHGQFVPARKQIALGFRSLSVEPILDEANLHKWVHSFSRDYLFLLLLAQAKVDFQQYQKDKQLGDLERAHKHLQLVDVFTDQIRLEFSEIDRKSLSSQTLSLYELGIQINYTFYQLTGELTYLNNALAYSEKNKVLTLQEHLNKGEGHSFSGIPEEIRLEEESMRMKISHQQRMYQGLSNRKDAGLLATEKIQRSLFDLYVAYDSLMELIHDRYPDYYALRYQIPDVEITDIQKRIGPEEAIISYFVGEKSTFVWYISRQKVIMEQLDAPDQIEKSLRTFNQHFEPDHMRDLLLAKQTAKDQFFHSFTHEGYDLYQHLFLPIEDHFTLGQTLTIIPDSYLGYLAFETLPRFLIMGEEADYRRIPYLIKDFAVGYSPSLALHLNLQEANPGSNAFYNYVGFAPTFPDEDLQEPDSLLALRSNFLQSLPFAQEEIKQVADLMNGRTFLGSSATVQNFVKEAPKGRIVHIASHSILEDLYPLDSRLIFSPEEEESELTLAEVYNLQMDAELVVLSSCESGKGALSKGEGIMSLSRAFFYAGSQSALITLWEVEDRAAKDILYPFFEQLQAEENKAKALQQSKLDFITYVGESSFAHPFFWGPFVLVGKQGAIEPATDRMLTYGLFISAIVICLSMIGFSYYQTRKKTTIL
ncbi:MAG: CHAT domain-containing tetratricopeptide repeat protein [Bacteroidota bacterium]